MKGIVIRSTGSWYSVKCEDGIQRECRIKGIFRISGSTTTNPIAAGDHVIVDSSKEDQFIITDIEPRKNYIIRRSVNLSRQSHIIAANLDQAVLFLTIRQPDIPLGFIDRFLVTAEAYHIPVIILFNKSDIYNAEELSVVKALAAEYEKIGYRSVVFSAEKDDPQIIRDLLKDKVTLLSGHSGVGKSTLINCVQPQLNLKTKAVSTSHEKGQHTTTFAEMFFLDFGGAVIDSPGIKGFGLVDMEKEELPQLFPEMRKIMHECRFKNCQHINEPGCAVKKAVDSGEIWENRYVNYLSIYHDDEDETYRGKGY